MDSMQTFNEAKQEALEWLRQEVAGLRSGRVKPDIIDSVQVEAYGSRSPLNTLASVSSSDARTLVVSPYDKSVIVDIEKAITHANLGVNPTVDGDVIRLSFPSLTDDIRKQTLKVLHDKAEEARVRMRKGRDEALKLVKDQKDKGDITEDDFFGARKSLDEAIDAANKEVEALAQKKEEDIQSI